jgi:hypothetical protein
MAMTSLSKNWSQFIEITPEIGVLLCSASIHSSPSTSEHIRKLVQNPFQWNALVELAKFHKVVPLLYQTLNRVCPDLVPEETLQHLQTLVHTNTCRNLFLTQELLHILQIFEEHCIPAIAFKGPTLALAAYSSLACRQIGDLDFLLPKKAIHSAQELLITNGYKLVGDYGWQFHFMSTNGYIYIDLHQEIAPRFYGLPFHFEKLWSRTRQIPLGGKTISDLRAEDLLLLLSLLWFRDCTYLNSHLSLHLLSDIDALITRNPSLDWSYVLNPSAFPGCDRIVKLALLSAKGWLRTDLPQNVIEHFQSEPLPPALLKFVESRLLHHPDRLYNLQGKSGFWEFIWKYNHCFYLQAREGLGARAYYCLCWLQMSIYVIFTPNAGDFNAWKLPSSFFLLYYPLHLLRLFIKYSHKSLNLVIKTVMKK